MKNNLILNLLRGGFSTENKIVRLAKRQSKVEREIVKLRRQISNSKIKTPTGDVYTNEFFVGNYVGKREAKIGKLEKLAAVLGRRKANFKSRVN